jgi:hypothetical protein
MVTITTDAPIEADLMRRKPDLAQYKSGNKMETNLLNNKKQD